MSGKIKRGREGGREGGRERGREGEKKRARDLSPGFGPHQSVTLANSHPGKGSLGTSLREPPPHLSLSASHGPQLCKGGGKEGGEQEGGAQQLEGGWGELRPKGPFQEPHGDIHEGGGQVDTQLDYVLRTGDGRPGGRGETTSQITTKHSTD